MSAKAKQFIEERYGPLGTGKKELTIKGQRYTLQGLMKALGLDFEGNKAIDAHLVEEELFVIRYYDGEDQRIVAYEFDADFRYVQEVRAHIAEWIGDEAYYDLGWGVWRPWTL